MVVSLYPDVLKTSFETEIPTADGRIGWFDSAEGFHFSFEERNTKSAQILSWFFTFNVTLFFLYTFHGKMLCEPIMPVFSKAHPLHRWNWPNLGRWSLGPDGPAVSAVSRNALLCLVVLVPCTSLSTDLISLLTSSNLPIKLLHICEIIV